MKRLAALALLLLALLAALPQGRAGARAVLLTADLVSGDGLSLLALLPDPAVDQVTVPTASGDVDARLFTPARGRSHSALILVTGYPQNVDDQAISRLGDRLARLGVVVLIPQLPRLQSGFLAAGDVHNLVGAFRWLQDHPGVAGDRIGFAGFCVGSSLALLAAADQQIRDDVALVNVFGGYYDLSEYLRAIALHQARYDGQEMAWDPAQQTELLFVQNMLHAVEDDADRRQIEAYLTGAGPWPQLQSPVAAAIFDLLQPAPAPLVDEALTTLPSLTGGLPRTLSPSAAVRDVRATVLIMHDRHDPYVPATESLALRDALTPVTDVRYTPFLLFDHVRPDVETNNLSLIPEALRLIRHLTHAFTALD